MRADIVPKTAVTGGTSESKPDAGTESDPTELLHTSPITTGDQAGAAILTILCAIIIVGGSVWLVT